MRKTAIFCTWLFTILVVNTWMMSSAYAGSLVAWGYTETGQSDIPIGSDFVAVADANWTSAALRSDGSLVGWGEDPSLGPYTVPTGNNFVAIAAGGFHFLALRADGSLAAWGNNGMGQCSVPSGTGYRSIDAGGYHSLALTAGGSIVAWGANDHGQLNVPQGSDFVAIACGPLHSLAIRTDGSLVAWGYNIIGQCNVPGGNDYVAVDGGNYHSIALKSDGSIVAWGNPNSGVCNVPAGNDFVSIAAGPDHNLALKTDGSIVAWGWNYWGQCNVPPLPSGWRYVDMDASLNHNMAVVTMPAVAVDIDIKPGSYPNSINLGSYGVIPVAIFSTGTFDATTINPETVQLAGAGVAIRGKGNKYMAQEQDVDEDGLMDLILHVETENLDPGQLQDGYAIVGGSTYNGILFIGQDEVVIVPPEN